jgi:hypothetical protein
MASWSVTASGSHALSAGVGQLHVHVDAFPLNARENGANPAEWFQIASIRATDGTCFWRAQYIDAEDCWLGIPTGANEIYYALAAGAELTITEVVAEHPLRGPTGSTGATGPAGTASDISARVYRSTNQSLTSGSLVTISFDTESWDTSALHDPSTHTERLTIPQTGVYVIGGCVAFTSNSTGRRLLILRQNGSGSGDGTAIILDSRTGVTGSGVETEVAVSSVWQFTAGDWLTLEVVQSSGSTLNALTHAPYSPSLWASLQA